jgi:hypothetical protein
LPAILPGFWDLQALTFVLNGHFNGAQCGQTGKALFNRYIKLTPGFL